VLPVAAVASGTLSVLLPTNPAAILYVVPAAGGGLEVRNTRGNRVVGVVAPSSLLPGGYVLVSGELKDTLDADFSSWRVHHRRPRLEDLVTPPPHFR
jgi:hypothetical protein